MTDTIKLKEDYRLAKCCNPRKGEQITGFLKLDSPIISIHKNGCINLEKVDDSRLVNLSWDEIIENAIEENLSDNSEYKTLDDVDFKILAHHQMMGNDYAAVVAKMTRLPLETVFKRHKILREINLLKRVQPKIIQYRKNIVKNKWIKHRNHTYYEITPKGKDFLEFYSKNN